MAVVNKVAQERYATFRAAITLVQETIDGPVRGFIEKADDAEVPSGAWSVPTPDELKRLADKVIVAVEDLTADAKKYEAELIAREWRI